MEEFSPTSPAEMRMGKIDDIKSRVAAAVDASRRYLFSQLTRDGFWCGELEADTTLESDYIFLHTLLGTGDPERLQKAAREVLKHQNADGGWPIYAGGPSNISAAVKAYQALKLTGYSPDHAALAKAREYILANGGGSGLNNFAKLYLFSLRHVHYRALPPL